MKLLTCEKRYDFKNIIIYLLITILIFSLSACAKKEDTPPTNKDDSSAESDVNESGVKIGGSIVSWANIKIDNPDLELTSEQIAVVRYFDRDYFNVDKYESLEKYPKAYRNAQVKFPVAVEKIIRADDDTYECIARWYDDYYGYDALDYHTDSWPTVKKEKLSIDNGKLIMIEGKQGAARITEGEIFIVYGRYLDIQSKEVDGKSFQLPTVSANYTQYFFPNSSGFDNLYSQQFIEEVAKAMFGNDIKITLADQNLSALMQRYVVTPDNQSNANFNNFIFDVTYPNIEPIDLSRINNYGDYEAIRAKEIRQLNMASDFEHYIVSLYEPELHKMYIEYFDRDFKKVWSREFNNVDTIPYDYTIDNIYLVADNDLYVIDTRTGEDKISPAMVGEKVKVNASQDGIILIGSGNKDNIMKVDLEGKIAWKVSAGMEVSSCDLLQVVDGNIIVRLSGVGSTGVGSSYDAAPGTFYASMAVVSAYGEMLLEFPDSSDMGIRMG